MKKRFKINIKRKIILVLCFIVFCVSLQFRINRIETQAEPVSLTVGAYILIISTLAAAGITFSYMNEISDFINLPSFDFDFSEAFFDTPAHQFNLLNEFVSAFSFLFREPTINRANVLALRARLQGDLYYVNAPMDFMEMVVNDFLHFSVAHSFSIAGSKIIFETEISDVFSEINIPVLSHSRLFDSGVYSLHRSYTYTTPDEKWFDDLFPENAKAFSHSNDVRLLANQYKNSLPNSFDYKGFAYTASIGNYYNTPPGFSSNTFFMHMDIFRNGSYFSSSPITRSMEDPRYLWSWFDYSFFDYFSRTGRYEFLGFYGTDDFVIRDDLYSSTFKDSSRGDYQIRALFLLTQSHVDYWFDPQFWAEIPIESFAFNALVSSHVLDVNMSNSSIVPGWQATLQTPNILSDYAGTIASIRSHSHLSDDNDSLWFAMPATLKGLVGAKMPDVVVPGSINVDLPNTNTWDDAEVKGLLGNILNVLNNVLDGIKALPAIIAQTLSVALVGDMALNFESMNNRTQLTTVFPFCIPFDLAHAIESLRVPPKAPTFGADFSGTIFGNYQFRLDLSEYESIAQIIRWTVWISFFIGLLFITPKLIRW